VDDQKLLDYLVELARNFDFDVRFERGSFKDGACRVEDRNIIVLNRTSPTLRKVTALSKALSSLPLDGVFIIPAARDAIERAGN
jgi:hypothetical protein